MADLPSPRQDTRPPLPVPAPAGRPLSVPGSQFRRVAAITDISKTAWRDELMPAHFDDCWFHVDTAARESGRRIVTHEFPKRDLPYSEDMGRSAVGFAVRAYCIVYPRDVDPEMPLYMRDYRIARNMLQDRLDEGGAGTLQLPTYRPMKVVCQHYRMVEEQKFGGYVVFDMQFVELGAPPFRPQPDTVENMIAHSRTLQARVLEKLARPHTPSSKLPVPKGR